MQPYKITLATIKELAAMIKEADRLKATYCGLGEKDALIADREAKIDQEVAIIAKVLNIGADTVLDMVYDVDFAKIVLDN